MVTGSTGFIGSQLVRRLIKNGEKVHIILRKEARTWRINDILDKVTCHSSDLSDPGELATIVENVRPAVIYHLATNGAYSYQNEADKIIQTNILGTWNLLKAASRIDYELFINTGSSSEYGFKKLPMKETDLLEPASYYAATKSSQTLLCAHVAREEKKPIVTLRPFSVYGPYEEPTRFIPTLMDALYFKKTMNLVSPKTARDYIYVDDMVEAYLLVDRLKQFAGEIFNIGTGVQSSVQEAVEKAVKVTGKRTDLSWKAMQPRMWDTDTWVADIAKAKKLLNWSPKVTFEKGLSLTWEWFKANYPVYAQIKK
ncbi:MAG: GDP-mannose 4,6-dehydratase [Candidatus Omnitrophica bacterium]|nr:GDP-mannose 4,6-dehydratase [Candidatus Omnitrophota bacterium]